ncbi:hypothetical protein, partial [Enterobacter hormaechei]|uniref:hypothetical protein n=1 Tax=Enterobacter hormaechei TaxID=158836 RepID=UPI002040C528
AVAAGKGVDRQQPAGCRGRCAMSRWLWWWLMLFSALVLVVPQAMAQRPPETHPTDEHRDIVICFDLSSIPF